MVFIVTREGVKERKTIIRRGTLRWDGRFSRQGRSYITFPDARFYGNEDYQHKRSSENREGDLKLMLIS